MPITRKRRAETIADNSPDRNVKRQSNRAKKNSNVNYNLDNYNEILEELEGSISQNDEEKSNPDRNVKRQSARVKNNNVKYNEAYSSRKNKEKSNFDPKNTTEKIRICSKCQKFGHFQDVCTSKETSPFPFCCAFCGGEKHDKSHCPARDETCSKCLKSGHFGNVCLSAGSGKKQLPDLRTHLKNNQGERQPGDLRERLSRQRNRENLDSEDPIERSPMARGRSPTPLYYDNAVIQAEIAETTIDKSSDHNLKRQSNRVKNNNNFLASSQKYCLGDIFYDRCRPSWAQTNSESQKVYIIPRT